MRAPQKVMNSHLCLAQKIYYQMIVGLLRRYFKQPQRMLEHAASAAF
jgi:hypothetical protein